MSEFKCGHCGGTNLEKRYHFGPGLNHVAWECLDCNYYTALPEDLQTPTKTLRDEFAMAALTGMACGFRTMDEWPEDLMADAAYRYADAMMQEREKVDE